ncbi:deetiolated 1-like protein, partial [Genlisea aurea]
FFFFRLEDGAVLDERVFHNDYINLAHSMGVFLYDDLLAVVSLRYQRIHILQIRDSGSLVDVRSIGEYCCEDDELFLNSTSQASHFLYRANPFLLALLTNRTLMVGNGSDSSIQHSQQDSFLSGLKQRLLSFIFRGIWNEEDDTASRMQCLKKRFYFHFQDYADLVMWRVQFLDRHHLFIKFGSVDGGVARNTENHPAFFAVYNMETTEIISFYQNSAEELYAMFERFCDHFHSSSKYSFHTNFLSTHSNNVYAQEQFRCNKNKANSLPQFMKKMLSTLPLNCQSQSPSPYFDHSLFRYDEKV